MISNRYNSSNIPFPTNKHSIACSMLLFNIFLQVSAFSTWEKELPKFIFDPRYMLLNTKERKTCFEVFIRSRAEEERKERKTKLKEKKDDFRKLLEEAKLNPK